MPEEIATREQEARHEMLESLADFDDDLLEQLLEDAVPPKDEIYQQLAKDLAGDLIVPVLLGAAERDHGVHRLLKALRHDVPGPAATAARIGVAPRRRRHGGRWSSRPITSRTPASCRSPASGARRSRTA